MLIHLSNTGNIIVYMNVTQIHMFRGSCMRLSSIHRIEPNRVLCVSSKYEPERNATRRRHSHQVMLHLNRIKMDTLKAKCVKVCDPNKKLSEQSKQCLDVIDGIKETAEEQRELKLDYLFYMLNDNHDEEK